MANIVLRLSTGSATSSTATNGNASLGGKMGTNPGAVIQPSNTSLNNLFDDITKSQNANGVSDYRCVYIHNDTSDDVAIFADGELFVNGTPLAQFDFGIAPSKNSDATTISNDQVAPAGISFTPAVVASPLKLMATNNVLNAGDYIYIWIRRKANNIPGTGTVVDSLPLTIRGSE